MASPVAAVAKEAEEVVNTATTVSLAGYQSDYLRQQAVGEAPIGTKVSVHRSTKAVTGSTGTITFRCEALPG